MLTGNLTDIGGELADSRATRDEPWIRWRETAANHSVFVKSPAAYSLSNYTRERSVEEGSRVAIENMIQDALPPLEDLVIAGHPGPIGSSSAIAVIVGGLFLVYRGIIDYRVPLLVAMAAFAAFLVLPVPIAVSATGAQWQPLVMPRLNQDLPVIITFINYEMLATPLLFTAFFLAASPPVCPTSSKARLAYATTVGILAAALQLYVSAPFGAYVALGLGGLLTPWLDKVLRTKPIV
jgi:Na+-transporting NADH:ubiquinone oxidoreductase subunit NqrB